jgi:hypothetical protein
MDMARSEQLRSRSVIGGTPCTFTQRMKEIDMFFQKRDPVYQTMRRTAQRLEKAGIPYAIMGAMAVNAHGAERTTRDVDVLLTREGLDSFRQAFVGKYYDQVPGRLRRFVERKSGVGVDILVTGHYPGRGGVKPFAFPHPDEASELIEQTKVVTLPQLVQLKLAAGRYYDFGDVTFLIRVHNLDESFLSQIHPAVHQDYRACLDEAREEKRRDEEYESEDDQVR